MLKTIIALLLIMLTFNTQAYEKQKENIISVSYFELNEPLDKLNDQIFLFLKSENEKYFSKDVKVSKEKEKIVSYKTEKIDLINAFDLNYTHSDDVFNLNTSFNNNEVPSVQINFKRSFEKNAHYYKNNTLLEISTFYFSIEKKPTEDLYITTGTKLFVISTNKNFKLPENFKIIESLEKNDSLF